MRAVGKCAIWIFFFLCVSSAVAVHKYPCGAHGVLMFEIWRFTSIFVESTAC